MLRGAANRRRGWTWPIGRTVLDCIESAIDRVDEAVAALEPAGQLTQGTLSAGHYRYLAVRELIEQASAGRSSPAGSPRLDAAAGAGRRPCPGPGTHRPSKKLLAMTDGDTRLALRAAADIESQMAAMESEPAEFGERLSDQLVEVIGETAMLDAIAGSVDVLKSRCLLWLRSPNIEADWGAGRYARLHLPVVVQREDLGSPAAIVPAIRSTARTHAG